MIRMDYFFQPLMMQRYLQHFNKLKYKKRKNNLLFLKEFSSTLPILKSALKEKNTFGGGFFIYYDNVGIAVDPGVGFLDLLHEYSYDIRDIDIVIVTHEHLDHSADLSKILSLNYDYNLYYENQHNLNNYCGLEKHNIRVYCDENSYIKYKEEISANDILISLHCETSIQLNKEIRIDIKEVAHGVPTYAVKIVKNNTKSIAYSSDTAYLEGLSTFLQDSDIIILNISEVKEKSSEGKQRQHLGYNGVFSILKELKQIDQDKLNEKNILISEFACLRSDNRLEIVKSLRKDSGLQNIYPATIGLRLDLIYNQIQCTRCGFNTDKPIILKYYKGEQSIAFFCSDCIL